MRKELENEIVEEFLDIINNHTIPKNHNTAKKKIPLLKTVAAIASAVIIALALTITIQSDSLKRNQTANTNESQQVKKNADVASRGSDSAGEMSYTTNKTLPHYLDEVYSTDAGTEIHEKTKLENL